ncbi:bifunctional lysylphosphatidylglycerol flippase/synthetase MprF [Leifsonia sp. NPDC058292]|uniref:bifunctional lysylphosphatidylglycerol flippase/synthetase MprF n=1 Tax=Leifsonia sp. NPDC058292 TaxID=3346428 RepID=UPI0036DBC558
MSTSPTAPRSPAQRPAQQPALVVALRRYLHVAPASVALAAVVVLTSIVTGTMWNPARTGGASLTWAAGVSTTIDSGRWWTTLTALFVTADPVQLVVVVLLALTLMASAERLLGTARAVLAFLVTGVLGIGLGVLIQWGAASVGELWAQATSFDFTLDPTVGIIGALITASAFASHLWRRRIRLLTFAVVAMFVLYDGDQNDFYRLIAALLGLALGALLRPGRMRALRRSSHSETRTLVAAVVAITAIGPLASLIPPGGFGPLSLLGQLFQHDLTSRDAVLTACDQNFTADCKLELALVGADGIGPLVLSLLPLVLLIVTAIGLRRGRHFALVLGIVVNVALIVLALVAFGVGNITLDAADAREFAQAIEVLIWLAAALLVPVASIVLLIVTRRQFQIRAPRSKVARFTILVVSAFVVLALAYLVAGLASLTEYVPDASIGDVFASTVRRFIPTGYDAVLGTIIYPTSPIVVVLYQWVGPAFWLVFVLATMRLYSATITGRTPSDEQHFLALLKRGGGGTLGFMGTWPGNVYWFTEDGEGAIPYRVINGIAIALSDPVCVPDRAERTITEFIGFCDANSWTPVFYSFHKPFLAVFESLAWQYASVGEETLMHPQTFDMAGKPWQKVRQAHNRGLKENMSTLWTTWDDLPPILATQITAISEQWVSEKQLPEMGFTLGAMDELKDPDVRLYLAIAPDGAVQAVTSWLPSYRDGQVVGYTIDFMRRGDDTIPGIMEFVIASAALHMQQLGVEVLSLSGAPLATKPVDTDGDADSPERSAMDRLLELLARILEPAYGFASLFKFKSKFNPTYETIYMAYPDPLALPAIGAAIGKAYLPDVTPKEYLALARTLIG